MLPARLRRMMAAVVALGAVLNPARAESPAGREPVQKQIKVPHSYYYREMYLPQVTSGPSSVAWSPDGREVVFSMQGSLWRQATDGAEVLQLTAGPGYDFQPDWSPDGRFVAYTSYREDALELRVLEVVSGQTWPLTENRAANVEPRWSPDGTRLAFVSTLFEGRWHVYTLDIEGDVEGGRAARLTRLTEDHDSGLPRYYYSRFDHFLSPTWSPDGRELILVSNRNRIWGAGGLWRMKAEPGAALREIHFEETTWKARPDWARDGKRVVWSSYHGRQWNQLWLGTADGGDPFPLTYGDFDATAPRWSPDGSRIAFVSNQDGNTSLRVIDVPGGRQARLDARTRHYREPIGRLTVECVDAATSKPLACRVSVTSADGRSFAPDDALRHADDSFDRSERRFEYGYFHSSGSASLTVPAGAVTVEASRGLEYRAPLQTVMLAANGEQSIRIPLAQIDDLAARGWVSGDLHVHMNYGGAYRMTPERLRLQAEAEDLRVVWNLIVNKEQRVPDIAYFNRGRADAASSADTLILHGQEFHTSFWGHTGLLGLTDNILLPDYAGYVNTAAASLHPTNALVSDLARAQGAVVGYVHPFDTVPDPAKMNEPLTHALPVDVALGKTDYYEVVGFSDHRATERVWHRLLNCGFRVAAGAGTDAMANFASLRGPVGMNRVYVRTGPGPLDQARFLEGLKAGRTFATNGPLLSLTLGGKGPGDELHLAAGRHRIEAGVHLRSIAPVDRLELVSNGVVVASLPLTGDRTAIDATVPVTVTRSGWYTLRASTDRSRHPILDIYPFATTSPIYVTVGGAAVRSPADARFFVAWIDRVVAAAEAHLGWNTAKEKAGVLALLAEARSVYLERGGRAAGTR